MLLGQRWGRLERLTIGLTDLKETGSTTIKKNNNNNSVVVVQKKKKVFYLFKSSSAIICMCQEDL